MDGTTVRPASQGLEDSVHDELARMGDTEAKQLVAAAASNDPRTWPVVGAPGSGRRYWLAPNAYLLEVDYCTTSGCQIKDKVTASKFTVTPGTNGYRADASLIDWRTEDSITQVHFQSFIYRGSQNLTRSQNCGTEACVNTNSWDSGPLTWGVGSIIPFKDSSQWDANRFWGYFAQTNTWIWSWGRTTDAYCGKTTTATYCTY